MATSSLHERMNSANARANTFGLVPPPSDLAELFRQVATEGEDPRSRAWELVAARERGNSTDNAMQELILLKKPKASVSVQVTDYVHDFVAEILARLSPLARWLLVHEVEVGTSIRTLREIATEFLIRDPGHIGALRTGAEVLDATVAGARAEVDRAAIAILQSDRGDVLGSYNISGDRKVILIHWIPIWLFARRLRVDYASLLLVTLAHEYAHYYTHLGRDSNVGRRRRANQQAPRTPVDEEFDGQASASEELDLETRELEGAFRRMDIYVKEGLAQFYTNLLCNSWIRENEPWSRNPLSAFEALLARQSRPYQWWQGWGQNAETVRAAILHARNTDSVVNEHVWTEYLDREAEHRSGGRGRGR